MEYKRENLITKDLLERLGLKENWVHARVNHNPSNACPGDELVIRMPKLTPNTVLYPGSQYLTYKYKLSSGKGETDIRIILLRLQ